MHKYGDFVLEDSIYNYAPTSKIFYTNRAKVQKKIMEKLNNLGAKKYLEEEYQIKLEEYLKKL